MDYEKGLDRFKQYGRDKKWLQELRIYESRLRENLQSERLYGTNEQVRSDRVRIVDQLNRLAQEQLEMSFNDLCLAVLLPIQEDSPQVSSGQESSVALRQGGVFVCYSHRDARYLDELRTQLAYYIRAGAIHYWDDTKILPGAIWREEIQKALQAARVAILLISADFFDSDFIIQKELPLLLDAAKHKQMTLLCVILRPCLFEDSVLAQFQTANNPSTPLSMMSQGKREDAWVKIAKHVKESLEAGD